MKTWTEQEIPIGEVGIEGWNLERVGDVGLYWKANSHGFEFIALNWTACRGEDPWTAPGLMVENLVSGVAHFDGIRHTYFGHQGYCNYPCATDIAKVFTRLRELEVEHCIEHREN